ncbi:hypothetical protein Aple_070140 [Acrocarpospora pleiomorpha]|uniref:Uncharacterized protein n=1 Tax=Acrocarpospora pleiomorpha TaxID=90975 RepID=A0A5M3XS79_9ACTN|nr:hypothetical protein Aple_070140 [Acrocarpospora pleiomorpha]
MGRSGLSIEWYCSDIDTRFTERERSRERNTAMSPWIFVAPARVPVPRPTTCAFVGPDQTTLAITTARVGLNTLALSEAPPSGRVLLLDPPHPLFRRLTDASVTGE